VDITARKRTEEALRNSQQQLKLILQDANIGLWNWNLKTDKVDYSREWKSQLGYEDDEIGDPLEEWLKRLHPDDYTRRSRSIGSSSSIPGRTSRWSSGYDTRMAPGAGFFHAPRSLAMRTERPSG